MKCEIGMIVTSECLEGESTKWLVQLDQLTILIDYEYMSKRNVDHPVSNSITIFISKSTD